MLAAQILLAAPQASSSVSVLGVVIGGAIAGSVQVIVLIAQTIGNKRKRGREIVAAGRMLRDDIRATQTRLARAILQKKWWSSASVTAALHTTDDMKSLAATITRFERWGAVTSSWRQSLELELLRKDGAKFDANDAARVFQYLEVGREILSEDVEKRGFTRHPKFDEVIALYPHNFAVPK